MDKAMPEILVVEDDLALSTGLCFELDEGGCLTVAAYNCQKARRLLKSTRFDDGFLRLNFQSLSAVRKGERLAVTPNEYKLLRILRANAGNIVTRQILLEKLWDSEGSFINDQPLP